MINIYSIFDKKAGVFNQPTYALTEGVFIRDLRTFLNEKNSILSQYPEDYDVYFVGVFDEHSGALESTVPLRVISLLDILNPESEVTDEQDT